LTFSLSRYFPAAPVVAPEHDAFCFAEPGKLQLSLKSQARRSGNADRYWPEALLIS